MRFILPSYGSENPQYLVIPRCPLPTSFDSIVTLGPTENLVVVVTLISELESFSASITLGWDSWPPIEAFVLVLTVFLSPIDEA
jgi:hypothetical protein